MSKSSAILNLKEAYSAWLQTLGFAESSQKKFPQYVHELLVWLEVKEISSPKAITATAIAAYFFQWKNRKNKRTGAGLSASHIGVAVTAIQNFIKFLNLTRSSHIQLTLTRESIVFKIPEVLTSAEIAALYKASYNNSRRINTAAYGQRDRAMLAVYYGCGLRRNEGNNLRLCDIQTPQQLLHVRKGKGSKERLVPIAEKGLQDIEEYVHYGRKHFLQHRQKRHKPDTDYFFINKQGEPMKDFTARLVHLKEEAGISKSFSLHTLRHSIATHLMQAGMEIEQIQKFLGHASLESTQIYTHILHEQL